MPAPGSQTERLYRQALTLLEGGRQNQALHCLQQLITIAPSHAQAHYQLGLIAAGQNQWQSALKSFQRSKAADPTNVLASHAVGLAWLHLEELQPAAASLDEAVALDPLFVPALVHRALAYQSLGDYNTALASLQNAIALEPDSADLHLRLGIAQHEQQHLKLAVESYNKAIELEPRMAFAYNGKAVALKDLGQLSEAVDCWMAALRIEPHSASTLSNLGAAMLELHQAEKSLHYCAAAIEHDKNYAPAYNNQANAYMALENYTMALHSYDQAIKLNPNYAEAYNHRAVALLKLDQPQQALVSCQRALSIANNSAEAYNNQGFILSELDQLDAAVGSFRAALQLKPDYEFLFGSFLHTKMQAVDWQHFAEDCEQLEQKILLKQKVSPIFPVLAITDCPQVQLLAAAIHVQHKHPSNNALGHIQSWPRHPRVRVAFLSSDFHETPAGYNMVGVFEAQDRSRFETYAVSYGPNTQTPMRQRLQKAFDHFIDVRNLSDVDVVRRLRELEIDVAVDIQGPTQNARGGIFALRCAPIQVNNFGWTSGTDYMDYIIADSVVIPSGHEHWYSERVVRLPNSFFATDNKKIISPYTPSRAAAGLPEQGFVFCAFNNTFKITPPVFECWMRILKQVPGSVLWLREKNTLAANNLKAQAQALGVDPERLIFAPRTESMADHLARQRLADLFLDNFPFGAQTTASDALWAGLPVVTRTGRALMSRVAASLLTAVGLPELITTDQMAYEALALELALHPLKLQSLRERLTLNRLNAPLFDTQQYAKDFGTAIQGMVAREFS